MRAFIDDLLEGLKVWAYIIIAIALFCVVMFGQVVLTAIGIVIATVVIFISIIAAIFYAIKELIFPSRD